MFLTYHLTTIRNVLTALPVAVWATPFLVFLVLYMVAWSPAAWLMAKPLQEIAIDSLYVGIDVLTDRRIDTEARVDL